MNNNNNAMENKQTAVDYLYLFLHQIGTANDKNNLKLYNKAKQMEKEQIINAYWSSYKEGQYSGDKTAEEYYKETYEQ